MRYKDQLPALGCETVRKGLLNGKPSENRWCVHLGAFDVPEDGMVTEPTVLYVHAVLPM